MDRTTTHDRDPVALLQRLISFDTTNPPGHEEPCIRFIRDLLTQAGVPTTVVARDPARPNLIARLQGRGEAPPFLMYGHVDVVTTANQAWDHPPFGGEIADGFVWGRGALDMKGGVAMMLAALLRANAEGLVPPGDIVLAIVSDEEAGSEYGADFLVSQHPEHFAGIRYAIGEFGGFSMALGDQTFYPIMIAEKQICWLRARLKGPGGHGSIPVRGGAMAKLGQLLTALDRRRLPVHVTPAVRVMVAEMADALGGLSGLLLRQLLNPRLTNLILDLMGERGRLFDPLLHNTVSPTMLDASDKINVIPSEVTLGLDGRLLPGLEPETMLAELRLLAGEEVSFEVVQYDPGPPEPDMGLFCVLKRVLKELDPLGTPVPLVLSGVTDARCFARLGIQTYGFTPMRLPPDFNFVEVIHAANERIPVDALAFGTEAIYRLLQYLSRGEV